jgi:ribonuclease HI
LAAQHLIKIRPIEQKIVIPRDSNSVLQAVSGGNKDTQDIKEYINSLLQNSKLILQCIPAHCGVTGNDKADELAKAGGNILL